MGGEGHRGQFYKHRRGVPGAHLEIILGRKMTVFAGRQLRVEHKFIVREDPDTRGGGSRNGKIEWATRSRLFRGSRRTGTALRLHRQGSSGGFFFTAIPTTAGASLAAPVDKGQE